MTLKIAIGKTIHRLRTERGMTVRAFQPHVSIGHLSPVERGLKEASNEMLENIATALDLSTADLLKEVVKELEDNEQRTTVTSEASH